MEKIYLVGAYFPYEGMEPLRAFASESDARSFMDAINVYHATQPKYDGSADYSARHRAWRTAHPEQRLNYCENYELEEVPFGQPPTES